MPLPSHPPILYGCAWKGARTAGLVQAALDAGFRAIDTAAQPKHYDEASAGAGVSAWLAARSAPRSSLWLQTKFTPMAGQDASKPLPYDPAAPLAAQVAASVASSLANLRTEYLDCLILHSPCARPSDTLAVWRAFEALHASGAVRALGISNIYDVAALEALWSAAAVKPSAVQNRFYADTGYDAGIRAFCASHGVAYQAFWTLTANPRLLASPLVARVAAARAGTRAQALFALLRARGATPLCGTTDAAHMREAVAAAAEWPPVAAADAAEFDALLAAESRRE